MDDVTKVQDFGEEGRALGRRLQALQDVALRLQAELTENERRHAEAAAGRTAELDAREADLAAREERVRAELANVRAARFEIEDARQDLLADREVHRSSALRDEKKIASRIADAVAAAELERDAAAARAEAFRATIGTMQAELAELRAAQAELNGRPLRDLLRESTGLREQIAELGKELLNRPTLTDLTELSTLRSRNAQLEADNARAKGIADRQAWLAAQIEAQRDLRDIAENQQRMLKERFDLQHAEKLELERRLAQRDDPTLDRDLRLQPILEPIAEFATAAFPGGEAMPDEGAWLAEIARALAEAGYRFPRRVLDAFHTSLKVTQYSPIAVLAGVSGTGKSKLPELYAAVGGLRFLKVAVQPNWDSPADLFGFFNYMDNRFKATPVVRALAQSGRPAFESDGFSNGMLLVLLDEMNLARIELYFSELMSRLEERSPRTSANVDVDLGSGVPQFKLPIGLNVLFAGAMNVDETTHTLSDKALDRSNVLKFARPAQLISRDASADPERGPALPFRTWQGWIREPGILRPDERETLRAAADAINDALGEVERAVGHRVWQAIELYVANYPSLHAAGADAGQRDLAIRRAFEDQFAQKIVPKLESLEVSASVKRECLDRIRPVLAAHADPGGHVLETFDRAAARRGAFTWLPPSSDYDEDDAG